MEERLGERRRAVAAASRERPFPARSSTGFLTLDLDTFIDLDLWPVTILVTAIVNSCHCTHASVQSSYTLVTVHPVEAQGARMPSMGAAGTQVEAVGGTCICPHL